MPSNPERVERMEQLAASITLTFGVALSLDYEDLKDAAAQLRAQNSRYEAIGILDGYAYLAKADDGRARLRRLEALLNFIEVCRETEPLIRRIEG